MVPPGTGVGGSGTLLPGAGPDTDVMVIVQEYKDSVSTRRLARVTFSGAASKVRWQSEPLEESAYRAEVEVIGDRIDALQNLIQVE